MKHTSDNSRHSANGPCDRFLDQLEPWLAGELAAQHGVAMQGHHETCPDCRMETRLAREIDSITRALPQQACPGIHPPAAASPSWSARLLATWRQPLVFVPAAALVLVALLLQPRLTEPPQQAQTVTIDGRQYSPAEILQAADGLELALRYLDKYGSYPAALVRAELEPSRQSPPPSRDDGDSPAI